MVHSFVWVPNTRSAAELCKQGYREESRFHGASAVPKDLRQRHPP